MDRRGFISNIFGGVLDRAYLVPLHNTLYDSEIIPMLKDKQILRGYPENNRLAFFQRPIGSDFKYYSTKIVKYLDSTNLYQIAMLDYPREFSVTGIGLFLESGISEKDKNEIINNAYLEFMCHNRMLCTIPLMLMPKVCSEAQLDKLISEEAPIAVGGCEVIRTQRIKDGFFPLDIKYDAQYSQNSGPVIGNKAALKDCFRLKPGEAFGVNLEFSKTPDLSKPCKIMVALDGYLWQPM